MSTPLKFLLASLLTLITLTACQPGVYYPFGDTNAQPNKAGRVTSAAPDLSVKTNPIVPS